MKNASSLNENYRVENNFPEGDKYLCFKVFYMQRVLNRELLRNYMNWLKKWKIFILRMIKSFIHAVFVTKHHLSVIRSNNLAFKLYCCFTPKLNFVTLKLKKVSRNTSSLKTS